MIQSKAVFFVEITNHTFHSRELVLTLSRVAVEVDTPPITGSFSAAHVNVVPFAPSNVASTCGARL